MQYSDHEKVAKRQKKILMQSYKTLFLAVFAIVSFIFACLYSLDIEASIVFSYFFICVLLVMAMIMLAFVVSLVLQFLKKIGPGLPRTSQMMEMARLAMTFGPLPSLKLKWMS